MEWAGHVAGTLEIRNVYEILVGNNMERDHVGDTDRRIILKRTTKE
jgi:hypothetical protein